MTRANNRRAEPGAMTTETMLLFGGLGIAATAGLPPYLGVVLGGKLAGVEPASKNPFVVLIGLVKGDVAMPPTGWIIAAATLALIILLAIAALLLTRAGTKNRSRVDRAAAYMGVGKDIEPLSLKSATATARRLGVTDSPGLPLGKCVANGQMLYGSFEDMQLLIAGPRIGKSTSLVIPAILAAPGAVIATSNKRDVVDAVRDIREAKGPVWVFDPMQVANEPADWWWNPLSYVTDDVQAKKLVDHFAAGSRDAGAKSDAFFDNSGRDLLSGFLLAAALDDRPITDVYLWLMKPSDETAAKILEERGPRLMAEMLFAMAAQPADQRGGVYSTAQQMASCLSNSRITRWITYDPAHADRPEFKPHDFVTDPTATLFSLSKEGKGSAGPLVTALTVAVVEAAEELAVRSPMGRLPIPMVGVLDEAANVCRWSELPSLYSHYGSRGIVLVTILQSWSQGVDVWGESGMKKLWSATNIAFYAGGVKEERYLSDISAFIGTYDRVTISSSSSKGGRSTSRQLTRDRILEVSDLASLPKGRAIVLASGCRPTLIAPQPWYEGPHKAAVEASIAAHSPERQRGPEGAEAAA